MDLLKNQKVTIKILCVLVVLLLLILVVGSAGFYSAKKLTKLSQDMYNERLHPIEIVDNIRLLSKDTEAKLLELIQTTDDSRKQSIIKEIDENTKLINKLQEEYQGIGLDEFAKNKFDELQRGLTAYRQARSDIIKLAVNGQQKEAFTLFENSKPIFAKSLSLRAEISEHNSKMGKILYENGAVTAENSIYTIILITILAFFLAGLLGWLLARAISVPLNKIVVAVNEIANGDLRDKKRQVVSKDEIGQLADAIAKMRDDLRSLIMRINNSSGQVAASSEELTATAQQSSQAASQVASAAVDISGETATQVKFVNNSKSVVETMSANVEEVAASTSGVADVADRTANTATQGLEAINKATAQIVKIEKTVMQSATIVEKLGERSKDIGQIIETISTIAGQTNLLALNAAIEAARAGEQGRGFAVVADEVRKLAEQSEAATKKIGILINETQEDTNRAVQSMQVGTQEVKVGTEVVNSAGQAFKEITNSINLVSSQVKEISESIQYMASNSQDIVVSITNIDEATKSTSLHIQTVSAAAEQQSASMEEISSSSMELAKLAEELQMSILGFKCK
ncbi:methyl-accepting chemotaxis protein [Pelosinus sp. sgz500959]|uniref:methyl-accepting chemotaxis protein n=1 Tax=Pelosinus sp. sgz500959 TaxID=3242472 RepID=UPI0036714518